MFEPINAYQVVDLTNTPVNGLAYRLAGGARREAMIASEVNGRRLIIHLDLADFKYHASLFGPQARPIEAMLYVEPKIEVDPSTSYGSTVSPSAGDLSLENGRAGIAAYDGAMGFTRDTELFDLWDTGISTTGSLWYKRWRFVHEIDGEVRVLREFNSTGAQAT